MTVAHVATMGGAYVMHAEDVLGSIEAGRLAAFVGIPVDSMTIPASDIWQIEPEMTVIGGVVVYRKPVPARKRREGTISPLAAAGEVRPRPKSRPASR